MKALVNKIIPFSSVDGPGNRMAIFLQGCNFNCLYCHNPETINLCNHCGVCVKSCPYDALSINDNKVQWNKTNCKNCDSCIKACSRYSSPKVSWMSEEEILCEIKKVRSFISGITVSGGECTQQSDFLVELFNEVKKLGLTSFVDSNGHFPFYENEALVNSMDSAMLDLKSYDIEENRKLTGMGNEIVIKNIEYLASINKLFEVRTVIVPELLNNYYNVDMTSKLIAKLDPSIRYKIIKYRSIGVREGFVNSYEPADEVMNKLKDVAIKNGCKDIVII